MSLVVFTALVGLSIAPGHVHPVIALTALLCIAVGAGAAGALNMWYDADIDARMPRTAGRPIPQGRVTPGEAAGFGLTLAVFSVATLGLLVNWVAAALLAFTIFVLCRDLYDVAEALDAAEHRHRRRRRRVAADHRLGGGDRRRRASSRSCCSSSSSSGRRRTSGRCRSTAPRTTRAPAFRCCRWSPAKQETRRQIVIYTLILAPLGVAPWLLGFAGPLYGIASIAAGAAMIALALRVRAERHGHAASKQMFGFSILYLFLLFAVLLADRLWGGLAAQAVSHFAA